MNGALKRVTVRRSTILAMLENMRKIGLRHCELLVLWIGNVDSRAGVGEVLHAFIPRQNPISSEEGVGYFVSGETLFELNRDLSATGMRLIAQVHSHPTVAYHSDADDRYAIVTREGGLSLVVPDFGAAAPDPRNWAIYRLQAGKWVELDNDTVASLFHVIDD